MKSKHTLEECIRISQAKGCLQTETHRRQGYMYWWVMKTLWPQAHRNLAVFLSVFTNSVLKWLNRVAIKLFCNFMHSCHRQWGLAVTKQGNNGVLGTGDPRLGNVPSRPINLHVCGTCRTWYILLSIPKYTFSLDTGALWDGQGVSGSTFDRWGN